MVPEVTYILCPITDIFISRFLYTLYKYSEPNTFKVIVIDQCKNQFRKEVMDYIMPLTHLYMHPKRNLGFAKGMNEGVLHALHWKSELICMSNDDIEIINKDWMNGIRKTFELDKRIMGVVPMSPKVAGWGYGVPTYPELIPYKKEFTEEDYQFLIKGDFSSIHHMPKTYPTKITGTVVDGSAFIMPYFKRECLEKIGLFDEHYFPGSGEDYDYTARCYRENLRFVSTSLSWVWHHWSKSKNLFASGEIEDEYYKPEDHPYWNNMGDLYPPAMNEGEDFDVWGFYHKEDENGNDIKVPLKRVDEIFVDQI